jgi:hypothetical protein
MIIEQILYILIISWLVVEHPLFGVIAELLNELLNPTNNQLIRFMIVKPTECLKCSALYVGIIWCLVFGLAWWIPIVCSFIMKVYDQKFNSMDL